MPNVDGSFTYFPADLTPGSKQIRVRGADYQNGTESNWTSFSFTLVDVTAPWVTQLALVTDDGQSGSDKVTSVPDVKGKLVSEHISVENVTVEFDLDGDGIADDETYANSTGDFTFVRSGIDLGSITLELDRSLCRKRQDFQVVSSWASFTYTLVGMSPPQVATFGLVHDTGSSSTDPVTIDATLSGSLTNGGNSVAFLTVEFDHDGDDQADGQTSSTESGSFTYTPAGLPFGQSTVRPERQNGIKFETKWRMGIGRRSQSHWRKTTVSIRPSLLTQPQSWIRRRRSPDWHTMHIAIRWRQRSCEP